MALAMLGSYMKLTRLARASEKEKRGKDHPWDRISDNFWECAGVRTYMVPGKVVQPVDDEESGVMEP